MDTPATFTISDAVAEIQVKHGRKNELLTALNNTPRSNQVERNSIIGKIFMVAKKIRKRRVGAFKKYCVDDEDDGISDDGDDRATAVTLDDDVPRDKPLTIPLSKGSVTLLVIHVY